MLLLNICHITVTALYELMSNDGIPVQMHWACNNFHSQSTTDCVFLSLIDQSWFRDDVSYAAQSHTPQTLIYCSFHSEIHQLLFNLLIRNEKQKKMQLFNEIQ